MQAGHEIFIQTSWPMVHSTIYALSAEFPGSSMERIVTLPPEKREEILGLVS